MPQSCDIFCNVVDNYGDIGVCWRLARSLAHEQAAEVRLWVDDPAATAGDLDAITQPDESAWLAERRPHLFY